jgi:hypothetical protein
LGRLLYPTAPDPLEPVVLPLPLPPELLRVVWIAEELGFVSGMLVLMLVSGRLMNGELGIWWSAPMLMLVLMCPGNVVFGFVWIVVVLVSIEVVIRVMTKNRTIIVVVLPSRVRAVLRRTAVSVWRSYVNMPRGGLPRTLNPPHG